MAQTFESSNSRKNIKGLMANPRTRTIVIIMGGLVAAMLLIGFFSRGNQQASDQSSGTKTIQAPNVQARPGTVTDTRYQQAVEDQNEQRLKAAQASGQTVLPTLTGPNNQASLDPLDNTRAPTTPVQVPQPQPVAAPPTTPQPQPVQAAAAPAPAAVDVTKTARYKTVETQIVGYMKSWVAPGAMQEFDYNGKGGPDFSAAAAATPATGIQTGATPAPAQNQPQAAAAASKGASFVRAGTIIPAVLLTSINSDTPGPVVAQIVSGPLAGARLLGNFQATEKEVVVRFSTLSMPGEPKSFSVSAYAVNSNLGTGLATDVDNHYFRRYGLLLAAGFIKGYGQAIARSGTTTTVTDGGGVIITQDELSNGQINRMALGEAGTTVAGDVQQAARVRPTVKVEGKDGGGVPIGLLFMSDF